MSKGTSGPWRVFAAKDASGRSFRHVLNDNGTLIASVAAGAVTRGAADANAHLIAAAPDLLAALVECRDTLAHVIAQEEAEGREVPVWLSGARKVAENALAKAGWES